MQHRGFAALVVLLLSTGCSDSAGTLAPTPLSGAPGSGSGAIVTGLVQSSGSSFAGAGSSAVTVRVVGTSLSTPTDSSGRFTLSRVPAGVVELGFAAPGIDARLALGELAQGETITIVVQVAGSSAVLTSANRGNNGEVRLSGVVERLSGTASAFVFFIAQVEIRGTGQTEFTGQGPSSQGFANLRNGRAVEVRGSLDGSMLQATRVHLEGDDDDDEADEDEDEDNEEADVEFDGRILSIGGNAPNLRLAVGGRTVHTSSATIIRRRGNVVGLDALAVQQDVEVEGRQQPDGIVTATKITIEDDGAEAQEVEFKGAISGLSPVSGCPSIRFGVGSWNVFTTSATEFDDIACGRLTNGTPVEVKGFREANGSVRARRVKLDD